MNASVRRILGVCHVMVALVSIAFDESASYSIYNSWSRIHVNETCCMMNKKKPFRGIEKQSSQSFVQNVKNDERIQLFQNIVTITHCVISGSFMCF